MTRTASLVWLFLGLLWGSVWVVIKVGLRDLPPFTFAGLRFGIASTVLLLGAAARGVAPPRDPAAWRLLAGTALLTISLQYGLQFWGQQYVASGLASILTSLIPVWVMLFAHVSLPSEPVTPGKLSGVALGVLGVAVIFSDQLRRQGPMALWGSVALVAGGAATARAQVWVKKYGGRIDPMAFAGLQMALGVVPLLLAGLAVEGSPLSLHWTPTAVLALAYLSVVGSALGFFLMYWLYRHMAVTQVMAVLFVNPVVAVVVGWAVLGEVLGWRALAGGLSVLAGVALVLRAGPPPARSPARDPAPRS